MVESGEVGKLKHQHPNHLMSLDEVGEALGCTRGQAKNLLGTHLQRRKVGRRVYVPISDVATFVSEGKCDCAGFKGPSTEYQWMIGENSMIIDAQLHLECLLGLLGRLSEDGKRKALCDRIERFRDLIPVFK